MNRQQLSRVAAFALLTMALLVAALVASSRLRYDRYTLLQGLTRNYVEVGGQFQTLRRFREADARGHVDMVFLGASHTYRGFDPRLFRHTSMNLGSTNQTPLNGYYIAMRYLPALSPRLVVLEVGYNTLTTDGLESCRDLLVNTPSSWPIDRMAVATWNLGAMGFAMAKSLGLTPNESEAQQREVAGETYVAGGYCETVGNRDALMTGGPIFFEIKPRQLDYLGEISDLVRARGADVLWVTLPVSRDYMRRIANRDELKRRIDHAASRAGVDYWDYSESLELDPLADFKDVLHLNAEGVAKFNRAFIDRLEASTHLR